MNIFLLVLSSVILLLTSYGIYKGSTFEVRNLFLGLLFYRSLFFVFQSLLFYTLYHNQLDTFFYHDTLTLISKDFINHPDDILSFYTGTYTDMHIPVWLQEYLTSEIRVAFFLKILSLVFILAAGNYYLMGFWLTLFGTFCFIPFIAMKRDLLNTKTWILVLLVPSFTIWTVGILKEAFIIPLLFLQYYYFEKIIRAKGSDLLSVIMFIALLLLVWNIKYYFAALFLVCTVVYCALSKIRQVYAIFLFGIAAAIGIYCLGFMHPALHIDVFPEVITISNHWTCSYADASDCVSFTLDNTWYSILMNFPKAMFYALLNPMPDQLHNFSSWVAAIENYTLVLLLLYMCYQWITKKVEIAGTEVLALAVILVIAGLLMLASPNIGSFSRYRIIYLPIYCFILFKNTGLAYLVPCKRLNS
jgi:hypothetical protein